MTLLGGHVNRGFAEDGVGIVENRLAFADQENGAYLYQANCLEIMDMIIAKHPQGCFDSRFIKPAKMC